MVAGVDAAFLMVAVAFVGWLKRRVVVEQVRPIELGPFVIRLRREPINQSSEGPVPKAEIEPARDMGAIAGLSERVLLELSDHPPSEGPT